MPDQQQPQGGSAQGAGFDGFGFGGFGYGGAYARAYDQFKRYAAGQDRPDPHSIQLSDQNFEPLFARYMIMPWCRDVK